MWYKRCRLTVNRIHIDLKRFADSAAYTESKTFSFYKNEEVIFLQQSENELVSVVTEYTQDDFLHTDKPYSEVYSYRSDPFMHSLKVEQMTAQALSVGFKKFKSTYKEYVKSVEMQRGANTIINHATQVTGPYLELDAGQYNVDDGGIYTIDQFGNYHVICHQPIIPFEVLRNIDTGEEKLNIAFRSRGEWRELIVSKEVLYNSRSISQLVRCGIDISSETAKDMVSYFQEIEALNRNVIPLKKSVSRLGHIGAEGFSPYVEGLAFDGEQNYSHIFAAIRSQGSYEAWKKTAIECRQKSLTARIVLAASFASVLIAPLGGLPFFVHLWGVDSGTGKTVALMLAASVWGSPEMGEYIQTFNSTEVGHEKMAAFLNSLPFLIDELQLSKDSHGRSRFDVYRLAQGVGRTRGTKTGGIERTPTWRNTIITTGESPIVSDSVGAGAVNRVIDINCSADNVVIEDGMTVSRAIKQNFGFAGHEFMKYMSKTFSDGKTMYDAAKKMYDEYFVELCHGDTTEKQAMAAAMILTADLMVCDAIFDKAPVTTVEEISRFLKTKKSVSAGERGYQFICSWVAANRNRFDTIDNTQEIYGVLSEEENIAYIIRSKFSDAVQSQGFDARALLSYMKTKGLISTRGRNYTRGKRIKGVNVECVALKLPDLESEFYNIKDFENIEEFELL